MQNTGTAAFGPRPFRHDYLIGCEAGLGTRLSTSFEIQARMSPHLSTVRPPWRTGVKGVHTKTPHGAHTKTPEGTRSLVAPTNVNTGQITRCSCPFEQGERYGAPHHRGKVVIHEIHRKHIVFEGVVHMLPTLRLERPCDVVRQQRSAVVADREAPLVGAVQVAQVPGVTSGALHVPTRRSGIKRIVDP
jgi:hypothetical protein